MPPLNLAPWEIPEGLLDSPHGLATAAYVVPWTNGLCAVLFRCVEVSFLKWVVFARPLESQEEGNWLVCNSNSSTPIVNHDESDWIKSIDHLAAEFKPLEFIKELVKLLRGDGSPIFFARLLVVDNEGEQLCLLWDEEGIGIWIDWRETSFETGAPFTLSKSSDDPPQILSLLKRDLADPDSDANFALNWSTLDFEEKRERLWGGAEQVAHSCSGHCKQSEFGPKHTAAHGNL